MPGMVGAERRGGRHAARGAGRQYDSIRATAAFQPVHRVGSSIGPDRRCLADSRTCPMGMFNTLSPVPPVGMGSAGDRVLGDGT